MSIISPFKGFRYSEITGSPEQLIAPPYDVIGTDYRKTLINRSKYNIVHLTLPESFKTDSHRAAADKLTKWCKEKILVQDKEEKYYILKQTFSYKKIIKRTGFIGLIDLSQSKRIIKHEVIFNKYRDDRIKILDMTKSNLEPIFLLYEDRKNLLEKIAENISYSVHIDFEDYNIEFTDCKPEILAHFIKKIEDGNFFIADGHHRFQASYEYYQQNPEKAPKYIMCYLTNLFSNSLVVFPTHRAVRNKINPAKKINEIRKFFNVETYQNLKDILNHIEQQTRCSFGVFYSGSFQTWTVKDIRKVKNSIPEKHSDQWKSLDTVILHYFILQEIFGIPADETLYYDKNPQSIVKKVETGECSIGFFMQMPDIMKIRDVSLNSEIIPPKTTFFYPKVPSGLVIARYI